MYPRLQTKKYEKYEPDVPEDNFHSNAKPSFDFVLFLHSKGLLSNQFFDIHKEYPFFPLKFDIINENNIPKIFTNTLADGIGGIHEVITLEGIFEAFQETPIFYFDILETKNTFNINIMNHIRTIWDIVVQFGLQKRVVFMFHKKAFEPSNFSILLFDFLLNGGLRYGITDNPETYEEAKQFIDEMGKGIGYYIYKPEMWSFDWSKVQPTSQYMSINVPKRTHSEGAHSRGITSLSASIPTPDLCAYSRIYGIHGMPYSSGENLPEITTAHCRGVLISVENYKLR